MVDIQIDNYEMEVQRVVGIIVLSFWAPWCEPCQLAKVFLADLELQYPKVKFCSSNINDCPKLGIQLGVKAIPALIYYVDGEIIYSHSGVVGKETISAILDRIEEKVNSFCENKDGG